MYLHRSLYFFVWFGLVLGGGDLFISQDGLTLIDIHLSLPPKTKVLRQKACTTSPRS